MFLIKTILRIIFVLKLVSADVVVCNNNECKKASLITADSLFSELSTIIEGHRNTSIFLREQNERIYNKIDNLTTEIANIKETLNEQAQKQEKLFTDWKNSKDESAAGQSESDYSVYDNLWIVIQRRQDGSVDFYRNWTDYKEGFGNYEGEFFVGLEKIYNLTNDRDHELLIILEDFEGVIKYAHYDHFLIGNETNHYILKNVGSYSGTAGDFLRMHVKMLFSTRDRDNDEANEGSCAEWFKGAWWYYHCLTSNLNGPYRYSRFLKESERGIGMTWGSFDDLQKSYKSSQMMLRAKY